MTIHHSPLEHRYSMFALTFAVIIGLVLSYLVALPFLPALVWSLTLAVLFAPVERLLRSKIRMSCVSVPLTMALAALMIVLAAGLVAGALGAQVVKGAGLIGAMLSAESWLEIARRHPALAPAIQWATSNIELQQLLQSFAAQLGTWGAGLIRGSASGVVNLLLTFYFLFYLLRDKEMILAAISRLVPLSDVEFRILANRMVRTIFASIYGTAAVASLQGVLGGLMFWWLDLPSGILGCDHGAARHNTVSRSIRCLDARSDCTRTGWTTAFGVDVNAMGHDRCRPVRQHSLSYPRGSSACDALLAFFHRYYRRFISVWHLWHRTWAIDRSRISNFARTSAVQTGCGAS